MAKDFRSLNQLQPKPQAAPKRTTQEIDGPKILARAEALIDTLKEDFLIWLTSELSAIQSILDRWQQNGVDDSGCDYILRTLHDLKAQSVTFGYPVISHLSASLHDHLTETPRESPTFSPLVDIHIKAIRSSTATAFLKIEGPEAKRLATELMEK
ncbi:MAG: hypothetical protein KUG61_05860 [Parvibaculaceae bacterium]|nr:hypothetical protein [Parvibaculaceae bacterium]